MEYVNEFGEDYLLEAGLVELSPSDRETLTIRKIINNNFLKYENESPFFLITNNRVFLVNRPNTNRNLFFLYFWKITH